MVRRSDFLPFPSGWTDENRVFLFMSCWTTTTTRHATERYNHLHKANESKKKEEEDVYTGSIVTQLDCLMMWRRSGSRAFMHCFQFREHWRQTGNLALIFAGPMVHPLAAPTCAIINHTRTACLRMKRLGWLDAGQCKHQLHVVNAGNTVRFIAPFVSAELMYTLMLFRSTFNCAEFPTCSSRLLKSIVNIYIRF